MLSNSTITPAHIDELLPQTQCGLCGHGGCMPYANAIVKESAAINLCPPGGVETLKALGQITSIDPTPYLADMQTKAKSPMVATIREQECIGCTKCIQACPVDAIIGSAKQMHSIITDQCTGCELCIPACPVDCMDMQPADYEKIDKAKADIFRQQLHIKQARLTEKVSAKKESLTTPLASNRKSYIELAIERAKLRKLEVKASTPASTLDCSKDL